MLMRNTRKNVCEEEQEADDESERIKKEMEIRKKDLEWEAEQMKTEVPEDEIVSVPISTAEAHATDKGQEVRPT